MPRSPRILGDNIHYHLILRCNNKEKLFSDEEDFEKVLWFLSRTKLQFSFRLYNYEILNSHMHLLLSTLNGGNVDKIMHYFSLLYSKNFNKRHGRTGHFWAHRYRSRIILDDKHGLGTLRYQHRNAMSAGLVERPEDWLWSGYRYYAFGVPSDLLEPHPSFLVLGENTEKRQQTYRDLVLTPIPTDKHGDFLEKANRPMSRRYLTMVKQVNGLLGQLK